MKWVPEKKSRKEYLKSSDIIDFENPEIKEKAGFFAQKAKSELELIQITYEWVRDEIPHSFDVNGKIVTCKASEVLKYKEGICYPKSHLLAALLRSNKIPTGFCYQLLILDDELYPFLVLHGLNAVYIQSLKKWIRLDARGNKKGVNARFCVEEESLAFTVRPEKGEKDFPLIYADPLPGVLECFVNSNTIEALRRNLPRS